MHEQLQRARMSEEQLAAEKQVADELLAWHIKQVQQALQELQHIDAHFMDFDKVTQVRLYSHLCKDVLDAPSCCNCHDNGATAHRFWCRRAAGSALATKPASCNKLMQSLR